MGELLLTGRILFVILFIFSGVGHFTRLKMMVPYTRQARVPFPEVAVLSTGVIVIAGGAGIGLGVWGDLASALIAGFLIPTAFFMHRFWSVDSEATQMQMPHFLKNIALAGAALVFFYLFKQAGDALPYTLTGPLFG